MPADSTTRICSEPDCERFVRARSLCAMHYKRQHPARPAIMTVICDGCGEEVSRQRPDRTAFTFCSELCRHWVQWGAWMSPWHPPRSANPPRLPVVERLIQCAWCGRCRGTKSSHASFCSRTCKAKAGHARRRARQFGAIGSYTWTDLTRLWRLFDRSCAYCGTATQLSDIQAEHVQALARGGANNVGNLLPSCASCNSDKRDLTLDEWAADRERRGLTAVVTAWMSDDMRYAHLSPRTALQLAA